MQKSDAKYPRFGVGIIILNADKVLLGRRLGLRGNGTYGLPGGALNENESFRACAEREIMEETGLENILISPFCMIDGLDDGIPFTDLIYWAFCEDGVPMVKEPDKVEKWIWSSISSLPVPLFVPTDIALKTFMANRGHENVNLFVQR